MHPSAISTLVKHLCSLGILALILMWAYFLIDITGFQALGRRNLQLQIQWHTVAAWQWYLVWVFGLIPSAIIAAGLIGLRKLFDAFARGDYFSTDNISHLQQFSVALLLQTIANPLVHTLHGVVLSLNHPAGAKILSIKAGSGDFKMLLIGLVLWVITAVLARGVDLQRENRQFV